MVLKVTPTSIIDVKGPQSQPQQGMSGQPMNSIWAGSSTEPPKKNPEPKVDTKVQGEQNTTKVSVNGKSADVKTDVNGNGNTTIINVNQYGTRGASGTTKKPTSTANPPKAEPAKPEAKPKSKSEPPMSARETEQRAEQLKEAAKGMGTDEEAFYNAVTTVPGGENGTTRQTNDLGSMDKRVFLSKENLIKLDKYLKDTNPQRNGKTYGLRYYILDEFNVKNRDDFYDSKMRELLNLLKEYGIK